MAKKLMVNNRKDGYACSPKKHSVKTNAHSKGHLKVKLGVAKKRSPKKTI
jgi:hypothetical protein